MKRLWAVVGDTFVVPINEISKADMEAILDMPGRRGISSIPVYFARGIGVWPRPASNCTVVEEIDEDTV